MTETTESRPYTIVVGVDGSPNGQLAFEWAVAEARLHHGRLRAVQAWSTPYDWQLEPMFPVNVDQVRDAAQHRLDQALAAVGTRDVDVRSELVEGMPGAVLVEAARDADLLVVGARGHSPLVQVLVGSVSTYCAHHAPCPIVIVPTERPGS
jgi:nucleotide-binding universal stress UspA family protein